VSELSFIEQVGALVDVPLEEAEALTEATLRTLARRISRGQARDLAQRVPVEFGPFLVKDREEAEAFPYDEFVELVADDADVDYLTADEGVGAVLRVLRDVVGEKEFADTMAQLPRELREMFTSRPGQR
jgi:uncharacterized protein (DUF2267 family)